MPATQEIPQGIGTNPGKSLSACLLQLGGQGDPLKEAAGIQPSDTAAPQGKEIPGGFGAPLHKASLKNGGKED